MRTFTPTGARRHHVVVPPRASIGEHRIVDGYIMAAGEIMAASEALAIATGDPSDEHSRCKGR
jgi:hypothetical protein